MLRGFRQRFVVVVGLPGQQHPERVDAKRRSERDIQQRHEAYDQGNRSRPFLSLQQAPAGEEACRSFRQYQPSDEGE